MNTSSIGSKTEAVILAALVKDGYTVSVPFGGHHRYDFVVDNGTDLLKVQCKTGRIRNGVLRFNTASRDKVWNNHTVVDRPYDNIDIFLVWESSVDQIWSIPVVTVTKGSMDLRIELPKNNQTKGVHWAKDYEGFSGLGANG